MIVGRLSGYAVVVDDVESARRLYKGGFFGKFIGYDKVKLDEVDTVNAPLILSLYEALYLVESGALNVVDENGRRLDAEELRSIGRSKIRYFDEIYSIYKYFRDRGYVVKSGLKFGALFSVYEHGPGIDHAPMIVVFVEPSRGMSPIDITRGGRLSHSVRKTFVLATVDDATKEVVFVAFEWIRP